MASSSDSDDSSSSDTDDDDESVFYDAHSSPTNNEIITSLQQEPRWRIPSKQDVLRLPEQFGNISLTENQLNDIQRRDKLQRLRGHDNRNSLNASVKSSTEFPSMLSSSSRVEQELSNETVSPAPDLLKDHINSEHTIRHKESSVSSTSRNTLTNSSSTSSDQRLSSYSTLPAKSARGTGRYHSTIQPSSASSESNIIDMNTIDRITKYGEISPNSRKLNDDEILRQPIVRNLDSGKYIPLSDANPMTQTIMERIHGTDSMIVLRHNSVIDTSSSSRKKSIDNIRKSAMNLSYKNDDNESTSSESSSHTTAMSVIAGRASPSTVRRTTSIRKQLTNLVVRNILRKGKNKAMDDHQDTGDDDEDEAERMLINDGSNGDLKYKASRYLKEPTHFDKTQLLQTIVNAHNGPIWCMRFSPDGNLLATGGQDSSLKVWAFKSAQPYFNDSSRSTSTSSQQHSEILTNRFNEFHRTMLSEPTTPTINAKLGLNEIQAPLYTKPFCELVGHQAPVLDVAWSKSLFLLSSSMDKTVRLWHLSRLECLCYFRHVDFVSAIAFHPRDDRFFVSASLDGHVRLWNIPDKRVVHWSLIPAQPSSQVTAAQANLITAVNFCDDGRKVTVGTFDGRFLLYTNSLQYDTVMNIGDRDGSRSHRSRKKRRKPYKITGIESMSSQNTKVLITSTDSRIRLYDIRSKEIERKYRGYSNQSSQIRASFSHDDRYIISGSEDSWFYIWRTEPNVDGNAHSLNSKLTRKQRRYFDRAYERIRVHNTMVTSAIFAPNPGAIMNHLYSINEYPPSTSRSTTPVQTPNVNSNRPRLNCLHQAVNSAESSSLPNNNGSIYVMVTADSKGQLKLLVNRYQR